MFYPIYTGLTRLSGVAANGNNDTVSTDSLASVKHLLEKNLNKQDEVVNLLVQSQRKQDDLLNGINNLISALQANQK